MLKRIASFVLIWAMLLPGFAVTAPAQEVIALEEETIEEEYDGYLVKFVPGVELPSESSNIKYVAGDIYFAETQEDILAEYDTDDIEYIEPNYQMAYLATPNDTYYSQQNDYLSQIHATALWDANMDGSGVTIAVIDSGLATGHEDINYNHVIQGKNYCNDSSDTEDTLGHGTQVTGIIAAVKDNGKGIAGLLSEVQILPLKVSNDSNQVSLEAVIKAIYGAVDDYQVQVINMSIGFESNSQALEEAVNHAADANVIMVAAAGNSGTATLLYPAAYDNVIGVGAVDAKNVVRASSQKNESVFVTAPGENIYTLTYGNRYEVNSGTSFASPFVAALAAAAKSENANLTLAEFQTLLQETSVDAGTEGYDTSYGYGIINMQTFVQQIEPETNETSSLVIKYQTEDGSALADESAAAIKADGSYTIAAPDISGYRAVGYKIEGAINDTLNTTCQLDTSVTAQIAYADINSTVTAITYLYERVQTFDDADTIKFSYAGNYGGTAADAFNDVALTDDGGYVAVGYTLGASKSPVWGFNTASYAYNDAIVVKFDADNNVEWAKNYGTTSTDLLNSVDQLEDGTIVAVGQVSHSFTEGGTSTASGYVLKINPNDPEDYKEEFLGGSKGDYLHAVVATKDGGYALAGRSASTDSETWKDVRVSQTTQDGVMAKFSADGTLQFSACFNITGNYLSRFYDIAEDADGNLIVVGDYQVAKYLYNSQIVKYNGTTGALMWSKGAGTTKTTSAASAAAGHTSSYVGVTVLSDGSYVATGTTKYSGSDTGENWGLTGTQDGIIVHYASDGTVLSGNNIGTISGSIYLEGATATSDGGYVVYGSTSDTVKETNVPYIWNISGSQDAIILKYDANNNFEWSKSYGYTGNDYIYDIAFTDKGEAIAVGESNSVGGALNVSNNGSTDAIVYTNKGIDAAKEILVACQTSNGTELQTQNSYLLEQDTPYTISAPDIAGYIATGYNITNASNETLDGTHELDADTQNQIAFADIETGVTKITYIYESIDFDGERLAYADGTYQDSAQGYGGLITVKVTISDAKIYNVEVVSHSESNIFGFDYMSKASEKIIPEITTSQSADVDIVSGATMSSNGLKKAVEKCLSQAQAATVAGYIEKIGTPVTSESEDLVLRAKNAYYMLDSYGRTNVTNYKELYLALKTLYPATTDADKSALSEAIAAANEKKEADYTAKSWETFAEALNNAKLIQENELAVQADIDQIAAVLNDAMNALELNEVKMGATTVKLQNKSATFNGKPIAIGNASINGSSGKVTYTYYKDKALKSALTSVPSAAGTYYVVAAVASDGAYEAATSEAVTLVISKASQTISGVSESYTKTGASAAFTLKAKATDGKVTYKSSNTSVIKINAATGKVTIQGAGTAKITVTAAETTNYKAAAKTITVKVTKASQKITAANASKSYKASKTKTAKQTFSIDAGTSGDGKLTYKVTKGSSYLTVTKTGKVTVKKGTPKGTYKVTVTSAATSKYKTATKVITITVK